MSTGAWLKPVGCVAIVLGLTMTATGGWLAPMSLTPETRAASSVLAEIAVSEVPSIGVTGFGGSYGDAGTPDLSRDTGSRGGDFADPDDVRDHLDVDGGPYATTEWAASDGELAAHAGGSALRLRYQGAKELLRVEGVTSRASCLSGGSAISRIHGTKTQVLRKDAPTMTVVHGEDLGLSTVDTARLTVSANPVERSVDHANEVSAEAYLDIRVNAEMRDHTDAVIHNGRILEAKLAHVKVNCSPGDKRSSTAATSTAPQGPSPSAQPVKAPASGDSPQHATPRASFPSSGTAILGIIATGLSCACLGALLLLVSRHRKRH